MKIKANKTNDIRHRRLKFYQKGTRLTKLFF